MLRTINIVGTAADQLFNLTNVILDETKSRNVCRAKSKLEAVLLKKNSFVHWKS